MNKLLVPLLASILITGSAFAQVGSTALEVQTGPATGQVQRIRNMPTRTAKFTVTKAQMNALSGAAGSVVLTTLPAKTIIIETTVKHSVALAGPSLSAATAQVTTSNNTYGTTFNVLQAVTNTAFDFYAVAKSESWGAVTPVNLTFATTGANLSALTSGSVDVWITYRTRQP